jgi:hypothetical protein
MIKQQLNDYVTASAHTHPLRRQPELTSEERTRSKSPSPQLSATAPLSYNQLQYNKNDLYKTICRVCVTYESNPNVRDLLRVIPRQQEADSERQTARDR